MLGIGQASQEASQGSGEVQPTPPVGQPVLIPGLASETPEATRGFEAEDEPDEGVVENLGPVAEPPGQARE